LCTLIYDYLQHLCTFMCTFSILWVTSGELDADAGDKLSGYLMDYCKIYESNILEERINSLEEKLLNEN